MIYKIENRILTHNLNTMKAIAISIPKPCHEDWTKMTPDEKGVFCGSCQKSVYDFTNKSDEEIVSVFEKKGKEKVCGRFAPSQLSRPVISFGNVSSTGSLAKFLCALLLVFGASLFSGTNAYGQTVKGEARPMKMGKISLKQMEPTKELEKEPTTEPRKTRNCKRLLQGEIGVAKMGEGVYVEVPQIAISGDTVIAMEEKTIETTNARPVKMTKEEMEALPTIENIGQIESVMMGATAVYIIEELIDPELLIAPAEEAVLVESTPIEETVILPFNREIKAAPVPSVGDITLSYMLEKNANVQIELFDITGKRAKVLEQQGNQYAGKYSVSHNISDLPNGIYIAKIIVDNKTASTRIVLAR